MLIGLKRERPILMFQKIALKVLIAFTTTYKFFLLFAIKVKFGRPDSRPGQLNNIF